MSTLTHKFLTLGITLLLFFQQGVAEAQSSPKVALTGGKILTVSGAPVAQPPKDTARTLKIQRAARRYSAIACYS